MIKNVEIQNFKSLLNVHIDLERFTVFVGPNGCGKTSVLQAIRKAVRAAGSQGPPQQAFLQETWQEQADWIFSRGGEGSLSIRIKTDSKNNQNVFFGVSGPNPKDLLPNQGWPLTVSPHHEALVPILKELQGLVFLRLDVEEMAKPSYVPNDLPQMEENGKGLASVLAYMALNDPASFQQLVNEAKALIPNLVNIRFKKAAVPKTERELVKIGNDSMEHRRVTPFMGEMILFDFQHADNIPAMGASEGTILMVGLLTVLLGPNRPKIVLIDDLEHGLHPLAQKNLVDVIRRIQAKNPELQFLATTHSPYLLNYLNPEEVRIMVTGEEGASRCGKLPDHPKFSKWKEEMSPGEMWTLFGEKWVSAKEPHP